MRTVTTIRRVGYSTIMTPDRMPIIGERGMWVEFRPLVVTGTEYADEPGPSILSWKDVTIRAFIPALTSAAFVAGVAQYLAQNPTLREKMREFGAPHGATIGANAYYRNREMGATLSVDLICSGECVESDRFEACGFAPSDSRNVCVPYES